MTWRSLRRWLRPLVVYAALLAICALARVAPVSDAGRAQLPSILLLFVLLALRGVVLFVVPAVLAYRLVAGRRG